MKKIFKKVMIILTVLLLFTTALPNKADKEADASISMTLAGIAATVGGSAMLPYALGAAGILAVGGVIKNWDVVKEYGENIIAKMGGYDVASGSYVQNPDGTATVIYSPAMKLAMAQAVDAMPTTIVSSDMVWNSLPILNNTGLSIAFPVGAVLRIAFDYVVTDDNSSLSADNGFNVHMTTQLSQTRTGPTVNPLVGTGVYSGHYEYDFPVSTENDIVKQIKITDHDYYQVNTVYTNIKYLVYDSTEGLPDQFISTVDSFGMVADNVNARLLGMNTVIADGQAVTFSADAELLNASIDDLASISDATLTETQTQTGILSQIWRSITSLPSSIAAAGLAASTAINTKMTDLWEDAGAIWSGMADSLINIQTDVNAKIGAMQTAMSGGIDNIRTDIGTMMDNLRAGIDSMAASAAANMASWGQLTLDGIDAGIGAITSGLTNAWTKTTTAIDTAATATTTAITNLTDKLTTGMDQITTWITDFPAMMMSIVIPPASEFSMAEKIAEIAELLEQKFGSMDELMTTIRGAFDQTGSIYEIEISLMGRQYKIVPIMLKPTIDGARPFLTAAVNLTSLTFLIHRNKKELFK